MYRVSEFGDQRSGEDSALRSWRAKLTSRERCPEGLLIPPPPNAEWWFGTTGRACNRGRGDGEEELLLGGKRDRRGAGAPN